MDTLNIVQWNAQSILHNQNIFNYFLLDKNIHIALICETWLKPYQKFKIRHYNVVRLDSGNAHNGVAILLHRSISYSKIDTFYDDSIQNVVVRIQYSSNKELTIVSFYSPANCSPSFCRNKIDRLIKSLPEPIFLAGDFNGLHSAWGCSTSNCRGKDILESINNNNLVLLNDGSMTTVGSHIWRQNALDLTIVSPSLALECDWSVHDDPLGSYHFPVITKILLNNNHYNATPIPNSSPLPYFPNLNNVDWNIYNLNVQQLLTEFSIDTQDPLQNYTKFTDILHSALWKSSSISTHSLVTTVSSSRCPSNVNIKKKKTSPLVEFKLHKSSIK